LELLSAIGDCKGKHSILSYQVKTNRFVVDPEEQKFYLDQVHDFALQQRFWEYVCEQSKERNVTYLGVVLVGYSEDWKNLEHISSDPPDLCSRLRPATTQILQPNERLLLDVGFGNGVGEKHSNWMLIDESRRSIEMFEPWGSNTLEPDLNQTRLAQDVIHYLKTCHRDFSRYTLIPSIMLCPLLQRYKLQGKHPLCVYYNMLYMLLRITCSKLTRGQILKMLSDLIPERDAYWINRLHCLLRYVATMEPRKIKVPFGLQTWLD
jgi:hypothetical protein